MPYLREQNIRHVLAHPLFAVNDRLEPQHFERCLLLFNSFELNGTRDAMQNQVLEEIIGSLTRFEIERLANKHDLEPYGPTPWIKGLTGGSDDHSSLNIGRVHTQFNGAPTLDNLLAGLDAGQGKPMGTAATPQTMAHNLYGIAYQFYKSRMPGSMDSQGQASLFPLRGQCPGPAAMRSPEHVLRPEAAREPGQDRVLVLFRQGPHSKGYDAQGGHGNQSSTTKPSWIWRMAASATCGKPRRSGRAS